jgi:hypothetical protein
MEGGASASASGASIQIEASTGAASGIVGPGGALVRGPPTRLAGTGTGEQEVSGLQVSVASADTGEQEVSGLQASVASADTGEQER